ncbi:membrane fusion protein (multidrug efflux system) [Paraburkholderia rhizosphaerae]|uniref:Membrane fusion protein (Multidrug efflux system) n=2 Tax=Paraburkholderia rhizosphaerae TaxID=480658 RepID=A0A4R8LAR2_9BURK|nr:HlyD family secretion protein [Paraburkholderia rhizosphaerae]TDY39060.1 membrane fusion protein (multidrug efflux system) [Paraburkholderia rhizosphaerae]
MAEGPAQEPGAHEGLRGERRAASDREHDVKRGEQGRREESTHRTSRDDDRRMSGEADRNVRAASAAGDRDDAHHDDSAHQSDNDGNGKDSDDPDKKPRSRKPLIILAALVLVLIAGAGIWAFATRNEVSTDDAYTDGNAITIAPKVSGYVVTLAVNDNTHVHRGDLLVVIDKRDYVAAVDQAKAQLGLAQAQLQSAQVQLDIARVQYPAQFQQAKAQVRSAQANLTQAQAAYQRQHSVDVRATSQQNIDAADAQQQTASASVQQARAQLQTASLVPQQIRQTQAAVAERQQQVEQARAQLEQAELNLSYCEIRAPSDGWVTRRNVQYGSFLQAGTSLFSIVTPQVWVTANFKESQLTRMRAGDKVKVDIDAYPDLELHGHVDSIQLGSGSRFSAFPAENATGNFVKIVQRVPVKILIDSGMPDDHPLPLGLSVTPKVYLK